MEEQIYLISKRDSIGQPFMEKQRCTYTSFMLPAHVNNGVMTDTLEK